MGYEERLQRRSGLSKLAAKRLEEKKEKEAPPKIPEVPKREIRVQNLPKSYSGVPSGLK